jgi:hypothetical protein
VSGGATIGETIYALVYIIHLFTSKFQFCMKASRHSPESGLLETWPRGMMHEAAMVEIICTFVDKGTFLKIVL